MLSECQEWVTEWLRYTDSFTAWAGQNPPPPIPGPVSSALKQLPQFMSVDQTNTVFCVCYDVEKAKKQWHRALAFGRFGVRSQIRDHLTLAKNSERTVFSGKRSRRKKINPTD